MWQYTEGAYSQVVNVAVHQGYIEPSREQYHTPMLSTAMSSIKQ